MDVELRELIRVLRSFLLAAGLLCGASVLGAESFSIDGGEIEARSRDRADDFRRAVEVLISPGPLTESDERVLAKVMATDCEQAKAQVRGLIVDTLRTGGGGFLDIWSTEWVLDKRPDFEEKNPLGLSANARLAIKGATSLGIIAALHQLRSTGHPVWAKWLGRFVFAAQALIAGRNVWLAYQEPMGAEAR